MDRKVILLGIICCINADHLNTDLLPPDLPPANVANIYHESGITFVSPTSRNLEISSSIIASLSPITHAFGYVSHNPNTPQELVRTHSSQLVTHGLHSSVSALRSPNGIQYSNINGQIASRRLADDGHSQQISLNANIAVQSPPSDVVHARFVENEYHGVHEINSRTQHFEYKVPFPRTVPQHVHNEHREHNFDQHSELDQHRQEPVFKHSTYGVPSSQVPSQAPTFIPPHVSSSAPLQIPFEIPPERPTFVPSNSPSQDEINEPTFIPTPEDIEALPIFQNDKFLSPSARHTKTPITQTIDSIFDKSFRPTAPTRVNIFEPSVHPTNTPITRTRQNIIGGNHQYANRFSLSDGTKVSEQGKLISPQEGWENVIAKTGEYEYVSPEGIPVKVKWIADHEGFRVLN